MTLEFKNLKCALGGKEIVKGVSGAVQCGKITAVLGPNGCGKSTLLRTLLDLIPSQGEIKSIGNRGYLPQAKEIYWPLECEAIIGLGNESAPLKKEMPSKLEISHLLDKRIDQVSGGERTLVLLARVLSSKPGILIADEPVAELDPAYQIKIMRILREEARRGAAVLITMHDVNLTAEFCDEVWLMKEGRFIAQDEAGRALVPSNLAAAFEVPFCRRAGTFVLK